MLPAKVAHLSLMAVSVSISQLKGNSNFLQATVFGLDSKWY